MLRILRRIAVLLLVTGAVAGALYFLVSAHDAVHDEAREAPAGSADTQTAGDASARDGLSADGRAGRHGRGHGPLGAGRGPLASGREETGGAEGTWPPPGERREGHGGHRQFSLGRGAAGVIGTSLQIGVLAAIVVGAQRLRRRSRTV